MNNKTYSFLLNNKQVVIEDTQNGYFNLLTTNPLTKLNCKMTKRSGNWVILGEHPFSETEITQIGLETNKAF
jgi:hypothetical protein